MKRESAVAVDRLAGDEPGVVRREENAATPTRSLWAPSWRLKATAS